MALEGPAARRAWWSFLGIGLLLMANDSESSPDPLGSRPNGQGRGDFRCPGKCEVERRKHWKYSEAVDEFKARLDRLWASRQEQDQHLSQILKTEDDFISIVLRGHLVLEELLYSAIAAHCPASDYLRKANLRFPQLVALLRALEKLPAVPGWLWNALAELNALRNSLAHRLEPADLRARVDRFVGTIPRDSEGDKRFPPPASPKEAVTRALHYMLGAMGVVSHFQSAMEELIAQSIEAHAKAAPPKAEH